MNNRSEIILKLEKDISEILKISQLNLKLHNITLQESENIQIYASRKLDYFKNVFNDFLKNIDNVDNSQEIFKNIIKKHYEKDYLPSWDKRNNSNYENLKWEINEAFYLAGLKVIFKKKEAA